MKQHTLYARPPTPSTGFINGVVRGCVAPAIFLPGTIVVVEEMLYADHMQITGARCHGSYPPFPVLSPSMFAPVGVA